MIFDELFIYFLNPGIQEIVKNEILDFWDSNLGPALKTQILTQLKIFAVYLFIWLDMAEW